MAIDKENYPALHHHIESAVATRLEWLTAAVRAGVLCEFLPEEIKKLKVISVDIRGTGLSISVENEPDTVRLLKVLGIYGLTPKVSSWSRKHFWTAGEGILSNGAPLHISVNNIEEPAGCVVEEKITTSKEFVLVCPQTGEEIK